MATNEEVKETVMDWLNGVVANFYEEGIVKLVQCLKKYLKCNGNYVEIQTYVVASYDIKIIWMNEVFFCL
jgi:hypothetical protein